MFQCVWWVGKRILPEHNFSSKAASRETSENVKNDRIRKKLTLLVIPIPFESCYYAIMKTSLRPLAPAILLLLAAGCGSVHWGDYFNAGDGPPERTRLITCLAFPGKRGPA